MSLQPRDPPSICLTESMGAVMTGYALDITAREAIALVVAIGTVIFLTMALAQRLKSNKGIGWQFIRFSAITLSLPLTTVLALTNSLDAPSAAILAGALGYAFGHPAENDKSSGEERKAGDSQEEARRKHDAEMSGRDHEKDGGEGANKHA